MKVQLICKDYILMEQRTILTGCIAIREDNPELAQSCVEELLTGDYSTEGFLQGARSMLLCAARKHNDELFARWLEQLEPRLSLIAGTRPYSVAAGDFLLSISFASCDGRRIEVLSILRRLVQKYLQFANDDSFLEDFLCEWSSMIARMSRRGWQEETSWLLKVLLSVLLRKRNLKLYDTVLLHLQMNFVMYCQWDGLEKAVAAYKELQLLYAYFIEKAVSSSTPPEERSKYFLLALRNIRGVVSNISRALMLDELEVFQDWYAMLQYQQSGNPKGQLRMKLLVQLSILYWKETRPRTSRKQMKYLKELLEPSVITAEYAELLQKII